MKADCRTKATDLGSRCGVASIALVLPFLRFVAASTLNAPPKNSSFFRYISILRTTNYFYDAFAFASARLCAQTGRAKDPVKFLLATEQRARERQVAYGK